MTAIVMRLMRVKMKFLTKENKRFYQITSRGEGAELTSTLELPY